MGEKRRRRAHVCEKSRGDVAAGGLDDCLERGVGRGKHGDALGEGQVVSDADSCEKGLALLRLLEDRCRGCDGVEQSGELGLGGCGGERVAFLHPARVSQFAQRPVPTRLHIQDTGVSPVHRQLQLGVHHPV